MAGDMKVEQTHNRVTKGPGSCFVVGENRKTASVSEYNLLYHEIGNITCLLDLVTNVGFGKSRECHLNSSFSPSRRKIYNTNVHKLLEYLQERQNPFIIETQVPIPLHHMITQEAVSRDVTSRLRKWKDRI